MYLANKWKSCNGNEHLKRNQHYQVVQTRLIILSAAFSYIPMAMLKYWPVASYLVLWFLHLLSYIKLKCSHHDYITCLPCQCYSESVTKCNFRASSFKIDHSSISMLCMMCTTTKRFGSWSLNLTIQLMLQCL